MAYAQGILERFSGEIRWAARQAVALFRPSIDYDDAVQEANILVLTYAGVMHGWKCRTLDRIEEAASGDEKRVHALVASQLRLDLNQVLGRGIARQETAGSLETLTAESEPSFMFEDSLIERIDRERELRERYPCLMMRHIDGLTESEIATAEHIAIQTVRNRMVMERRRAARDPELRANAGLEIAA